MKQLRLLLIGAGLAVIYTLPLFVLPGFSAAYLKFGDIEGESTNEIHKDEIDVLSWSWKVSRPSTSVAGSSRDTGVANVNDFSFTHNYDKASPLLALRCFEGQATPEVVLTVDAPTGSEPVEYLVISFLDVIITSVAQTNDAAANDRPLETVSFNFREMKVEYSQVVGDKTVGTTQFEWNIETNKGS